MSEGGVSDWVREMVDTKLEVLQLHVHSVSSLLTIYCVDLLSITAMHQVGPQGLCTGPFLIFQAFVHMPPPQRRSLPAVANISSPHSL